jgi:nucleotide-binding universal stress UspA family protein
MGSAASNPRLDIKPPGPGHRILVCLDGSPYSQACLPYGVSLAKTFGSALTLVRVMQPRHEHGHEHGGPQMTDAVGWEISRQEARGYLERLQKEATAALGRPAEIRLEQGHPAERIVDVAREIGADLTVLGSHGEGGVTSWNLGSTVQQVLAVARGSVFVAHSSSVVPVVVSPRRIMVPLDGSLRTESVLPTAARIASAYGAELLLVHVVQEPLPSSVLAAEDLELARKLAVRLEFGAKRYLDRLGNRLAREVGTVRTLAVRHANERQCLLEIAQRERSDLVVLSAHGAACDPARCFGSVTADLLRNSTVPVLVLQDLPGGALEAVENVGEALAPPLRASFPPQGI